MNIVFRHVLRWLQRRCLHPAPRHLRGRTDGPSGPVWCPACGAVRCGGEEGWLLPDPLAAAGAGGTLRLVGAPRPGEPVPGSVPVFYRNAPLQEVLLPVLDRAARACASNVPADELAAGPAGAGLAFLDRGSWEAVVDKLEEVQAWARGQERSSHWWHATGLDDEVGAAIGRPPAQRRGLTAPPAVRLAEAPEGVPGRG